DGALSRTAPETARRRAFGVTGVEARRAHQRDTAAHHRARLRPRGGTAQRLLSLSTVVGNSLNALALRIASFLSFLALRIASFLSFLALRIASFLSFLALR